MIKMTTTTLMTWSEWKKKEKEKDTKPVYGKGTTKQTNDPMFERERNKNEWMSAVSLCTMKSRLISMLTRNFIWKAFFPITCAIHRGRLIPLFLFRRKRTNEKKKKNALIRLFFIRNFHLPPPPTHGVCIWWRISVLLACCRVLWTYFGMPWEFVCSCDKFAWDKKDVTKMIMVMMKLNERDRDRRSMALCGLQREKEL